MTNFFHLLLLFLTPKSVLLFRLNNNKWLDQKFNVYALKNGAIERIEELKIEFNSLQKKLVADTLDELSRNETSTRMNEIQILLDGFNALLEIENDLKMFEEQQNSTDESIKQSAKRFLKEFQQCKDEIEFQLNQSL